MPPLIELRPEVHATSRPSTPQWRFPISENPTLVLCPSRLVGANLELPHRMAQLCQGRGGSQNVLSEISLALGNPNG